MGNMTHFERFSMERLEDNQHLPPRIQETLSTPYNEKYSGWEEITIEEFARSRFFTECIIAHQYKQVVLDPDKGQEGVRCFVFIDGGGFALAGEYWEKRLRIFRFGCDHEMEFQEQLGRCYRRYRCKKCGYTQDIDSSD